MLAALAALTLVASAQAAPRPVTPVKRSTGLALSGDYVLYARARDRIVRVFAEPVAGGTPRRIFAHTVPAGRRVSPSLFASSEWAALTLTLERGETMTAQAFAGPPSGPWTALPSVTDDGSADFPFVNKVAGPLSYTVVGDTLVVRDPAPHTITFEGASEALSATVAGDLVAYAREDEESRGRLVIRNWRTGATLRTADFDRSIQSIALRPDGRAALAVDERGLYDLRPGAPPRRLTRAADRLVFAGDRIVFAGDTGLRVAEADGRIRRFGAPTAGLGPFVADERHVLWAANDCVLVAPISDPAATAIAPGPCARSELVAPQQPAPKLARTHPIRLYCVTAPSACRGTIRVRDARTRFTIPAGHRRTIRVRLPDAALRALRGGDPVFADIRTDDGERLPPQELTVAG